jgi:hypothetical protein
VDGNIANKGVDCDFMWLGSDFIAGPFTDAVDHVNGQTGQVTWDVTLNVLQVLANGKTEVNWLVRFANESANGMVKYYSKEGAAQNQNYSLGPQLVLAP